MSWAIGVVVRLARWSSSRRGLALVYHRVADVSGHEDELLPAIGVRTFERQLRHLRAHYRLVPASELPDAALSRSRGERFPVAITFDDDYISHREKAMPALLRQRAPATFFVSGASFDRPFSFWWENLERASSEGIPPESILGGADPAPRTVHEVAATIQAMDRESREVVAARLEARLGRAADPAQRGMSTDDVRALAEAGLEIGFHTLEHHSLTTLGPAELEEAMVKGRDRLAALAGRDLSTIAYPHGEVDARVAASAREAGFTTGYTTSAEPFTVGTDRLLIGRFTPSASEHGFALGVMRALFA